MADDMDSAERKYHDAIQAQLGERVTNLGRRVTDIEGEMCAGFRQIEASLSTLTSTLAERNKPHWQALGVALTFAALIGGLAYMPIREATTDLKTSVIETNKAIQGLAANTISRQEMDWRSARAAEDRDRWNAAVTELRASDDRTAERLARLEAQVEIFQKLIRLP